jgi:hypothetical protein
MERRPDLQPYTAAGLALQSTVAICSGALITIDAGRSLERDEWQRRAFRIANWRISSWNA